MTEQKLRAVFFQNMQEIQNKLNPDFSLRKGMNIAVAVSGGADSMALALLLEDWCQDQGIQLTILTLDHCLRPDSAKEVLWVHDQFAQRGIKTIILKLKEELNSERSIQEKARTARYKLLLRTCKTHNIHHLFVAHHADDQLETFLHRLVSGSGLNGLLGMQNLFVKENIRLIRPLLNVNKTELVAYLQAQNQTWIEDPSNQNKRFTRVRLRQLSQELRNEGLDAKRLGLLTNRLSRVHQALDFYTEKAIKNYVDFSGQSYARLSFKALSDVPDEIGIRVLDYLIRATTQQWEVYPKLEGLELLYNVMQSGKAHSGQTFFGAFVCFDPEKEEWIVAREHGAIAKEKQVIKEEKFIWDDRFLIKQATDFEIRPFEESDTHVFKAQDKERVFSDTPVYIRKTWPVIVNPVDRSIVASALFSLREDLEVVSLAFLSGHAKL